MSDRITPEMVRGWARDFGCIYNRHPDSKELREVADQMGADAKRMEALEARVHDLTDCQPETVGVPGEMQQESETARQLIEVRTETGTSSGPYPCKACQGTGLLVVPEVTP